MATEKELNDYIESYNTAVRQQFEKEMQSLRETGTYDFGWDEKIFRDAREGRTSFNSSIGAKLTYQESQYAHQKMMEFRRGLEKTIQDNFIQRGLDPLSVLHKHEAERIMQEVSKMTGLDEKAKKQVYLSIATAVIESVNLQGRWVKPLRFPKQVFDTGDAGDCADGNRIGLNGMIAEIKKDRLANYPQMPSLLNCLRDEDYEVIIRSIENDLGKEVKQINHNGAVSFNKVYDAKSPQGDDLIVKVTGNKTKAKIEAAANYHLYKHDVLGMYFAEGLVPEPIKIGDVYLTVQRRVEDNSEHDAAYFMTALAYIHAYAGSALKETGVIVPVLEKREFGEIIDNAKTKLPVKVRTLKGKYDDAAALVNETDDLVISPTDLKQDNIIGGKFIDLESFKVADRAYSIASYLVNNHSMETEKWKSYIQAYTDTINRVTNGSVFLDASDLERRVKEIAIVPAAREVGGIHSRKMGLEQRRKSSLLENAL